MVLLKLHCEVMEATLSALVAMVSGGRDGGSPTRSTGAPTEVRTDVRRGDSFCPLAGANTAVRTVDQKKVN